MRVLESEVPVSGSRQLQQTATEGPTSTVAPVAPTKDTGAAEPTKFSALARKEKVLYQQQQALKQREETLRAKELEYATGYVKKSNLTKNAYETLQDIDPDFYAKYSAEVAEKTGSLTPEQQELKALRAEMLELKAGREETKKMIEDQQTQGYNQAKVQIANDVTELIENDPEFDTIKRTGSVNKVVDLIEAWFNKFKTIPSLEVAAKKVEEYLVEEYATGAAYPNVKRKLTPHEKQEIAQAAIKDAESGELRHVPSGNLTPAQKQFKTITNNIESSNRAIKRSEKERRDRAIAVMSGQKLE